MTRPLLSVFGAGLLCALSFTALAANSTSSAGTDSSEHQVREQIEAKRDQLSGADKIKPVQKGATTLLDAPVETEDAPLQVQQP